MKRTMVLIGIAIVFAVVAIMLACNAAFAVLPDEMLSNPVQEARALALSKNLRCVVCQNQNIDDSAAPIARDMRLLLRERIAAGDSDSQAVSYLVQRYGNYVLLQPPFQQDTLILWLAPFGVLLIATLGFFYPFRNRKSISPPAPLSDAERKRLATILRKAGSDR